MSRPRPITDGQERPVNLVVLLREAYVALNDLVPAGWPSAATTAIRPAHSAVFQYLDETGTTVSQLAERAQMTKQAMAELVEHLETHGYVVRRPNPADGRSKLVIRPSAGIEVVAIAQALVPEVERARGAGGRAAAGWTGSAQDLVAIQRRPRSAAKQRGQLRQLQRRDQRVGVPMHQQPVGAVAPVDVGDPDRQVLVGLITDPAVLPLDHAQDDGVAPGVGLHVLERRLAVGEGARPRRQLPGPVLVPAGRPAVRRAAG